MCKILYIHDILARLILFEIVKYVKTLAAVLIENFKTKLKVKEENTKFKRMTSRTK